MIPKTIIGIVGFLLFVGYITSHVLDTKNTVDTDNYAREIQKSVNSTYDGGVFSDLYNFGASIWVTVTTIFKLATFQIEGMPTEMSLFFDILITNLIIGTIFLIRGIRE